MCARNSSGGTFMSAPSFLVCARLTQSHSTNHSFIHSFILETYIAPLQETTTQRRSDTFWHHSQGPSSMDPFSFLCAVFLKPYILSRCQIRSPKGPGFVHQLKLLALSY